MTALDAILSPHVAPAPVAVHRDRTRIRYTMMVTRLAGWARLRGLTLAA